jgi:hypothetical protein
MKKIFILIFALIACLSVYGNRVAFSQPRGINPGNVFPIFAVPISDIDSFKRPYFLARPCTLAICPGVTTGGFIIGINNLINDQADCLQEIAQRINPLSEKCQISPRQNNITTNTQRSSSNATVLNKSNTLPKGSFGGKTVKLNKFFTLSLTGMDPKIRKMLNSSEVQVSRAMRGKKRTRLVYYLTIR